VEEGLRHRRSLYRMRYLPLAGFLVLSLLWGSSWVLRASGPSQPPLLSLAIQYGISAAVLLPWAIHRRFWRRPLFGIVNAVIVGIGILCLPQLLIFFSKDRLSPTIFVAVLATVPTFLAVSGRLAISTAVGGLAGILFLLDRDLDISIRQSLWILPPLAAAGVLAWALAGAERHLPTISIIEALFGQCTVSALMLFVASRLLEHETVIWSAAAAIGFAISAAFTTVCGYLLFYWFLSKSGAGRASMLQWTQPLVATAESILLMSTRPDWTVILGATLIVIAIARGFSNGDDSGGVIFEITRS
jgi:drug/metabolite transporter (DMT)-like permease